MAGFYPIPDTITAQTLTEVPSHLWSTKTTEWLPGSGNPSLIFLEGPTTDTQGNLFVVDVAYGRILRYDLNGRGGDKGDGAKDAGWTVLADYDGEPNGLALDLDGTLIVADYKNGITGELGYRLQRKNMERFKGPNDLIVASNGDLYFTDQGQTGMTDQSGLVYRLSPSGRLDTLLSNGISPNGLVLSPDEKVLYVAQTRDNSVWRLPLHKDGTTSKVCKFFQSFGYTGPDGLTVDAEGNLFICHPNLLSIFVVTRHGVPLARIVPPPDSGTSVTNCIFGSRASDRKRLYFTASTTGRICYVDWHCEGATPIRASRAD